MSGCNSLSLVILASLAMQAKTNPKAFWGHARRSLKTKPGVAPLLLNPKDKGSMKFNDGEKASILLQQFSSVFTQESDGDIPTLESRTDRRLNELLMTPQMVAKELKDLNLNKSCGPSDELHPSLLYELGSHRRASRNSVQCHTERG